MTEIPAPQLKRSKARRAAIGGGDDAGDAAPATESKPAAAVESAPAAAAPAAPAEPAPAPPPEPVRPEVEAYRRRRKIPYWAMPVLAAVPLWAYVYQGTLEPAPVEESGPLVEGERIYASAGCSGCHGANGAGSSAVPGFAEVTEVWPDYRDHMMWVRLGDPGWPADTYGANDKPKGSGMPEHPSLSDAELAAVVLYERTQFAGEEEADQEDLIAIAEGEKTFADVGLGPVSEKAGVSPDALGG